MNLARNLFALALLVTSLCAGAQVQVVVEDMPYAPIARLEVVVRPDLSREDVNGNVKLAVQLVNHSLDTLRYVSMSCSYDDMFELDLGMPYVIFSLDCGKNVPVVRTIKPHSIEFVYVMLEPMRGADPKKSFASKVGFWFVDADVHPDIIDAYTQCTTRGTLLWSAESYEDFFKP